MSWLLFISKFLHFQIHEDEDEEEKRLGLRNKEEVFLTYNCSSHLQHLSCKSPHTNIVNWNSLPQHVICVFPHVLSVTSDAIEFRSVVNGALLQTMALPELVLISTKVRACKSRKTYYRKSSELSF